MKTDQSSKIVNRFKLTLPIIIFQLIQEVLSDSIRVIKLL